MTNDEGSQNDRMTTVRSDCVILSAFVIFLVALANLRRVDSEFLSKTAMAFEKRRRNLRLTACAER
jgi:hypothetical protein